MSLSLSYSVKVGQFFLSYQLEGQPTDTCLLFLHGLQTQKSVFADLQNRLKTSLSIPQLSVDLLGFGLSDKPANFRYDLEDQLDLVLNLLAYLKIRSVHVVGHSLGGMIGTLMMSKAPNIIRSLTSLEGNLQEKDCGESKRVAEMPFEQFKNAYYDTLKTSLKMSNEPSASLRSNSLALIPDVVFYKTSESIVAHAESGKLMEMFRDFSKPKLMICGDKSSFHSRTRNGEINSIEIAGAGHFMLLDKPLETAQAVSGFLTSADFE